MKTGCEYMKCTHLKDGICQYEGAICKYREHDEHTCRSQLDLLMADLMVREKCSEIWHFVGGRCPVCEGSLTITRPASVEEVRQFIVETYQILGTFGYVYADSQKTLFMKDGVKTESRQDEASSPMKGEGK